MSSFENSLVYDIVPSESDNYLVKRKINNVPDGKYLNKNIFFKSYKTHLNNLFIVTFSTNIYRRTNVSLII